MAALVLAGLAAFWTQQATAGPTSEQAVTRPSPAGGPQDAGAAKSAGRTALPSAVLSAFKSAYPAAVIKHTSKEQEGGKTVYEIESLDRGVNRDLLYAPDGTVIECEEQIRETDLPTPVAEAVKRLYPHATIAKAERTTRGDTLQYDLALRGAPRAEVSLLPDGTLVVERPPAKK